MNTKSDYISELRQRIAEEADSWLKEHVFEYLPQQADWNDLPPENFIEERQCRKWFDRKRMEEAIRHSQTSKNQAKYTRMGIIQALGINRKLVILGDPGLGKTTCLKYVVSIYAKDGRKPLPIYMKLEWFDESYRDLVEFISLTLDIDLDELKQENFIFLMDGFNELELIRQELFLRKLLHLQSFYRRSQWVITSRKISNPYGSVMENWATCELLEFDDDCIQTYMNIALGYENSQRVWHYIKKQNLLDIARVPLLLKFICELYSIDHPLPNTKGGLLDDIIRHKYLSDDFLKKALKKADVTLHNIEAEGLLSLISRVAFIAFEDTGKIYFDEILLKRVFKEYNQLKIWNIVHLFEDLRLIERHKVKTDGSETQILFSFWHQTFFDYFIACHLNDIFIKDQLWIFKMKFHVILNIIGGTSL